MKPIETLSNEHGLIRHYLDNLNLAADQIAAGRHPSEAFFDKAVDFAKTFTDGFHHFKEEHVLFVQVAQKKRGEVDAQLDALRHEHERGRTLVADISRALPGYAAGDPVKTGELVEALGAYTALLKHHIHVEDHVFYPMAERTLTAAELETVAAEFDKQHERHGRDTFERCHKTVVDMGSILTHVR
ncbi:MAG: hemerythrin domain-containing protein [Thermoanaerobaculales bacterium]|jgi:hemerythrin-like domain-containing protein|nr:hemerythrin domain-containing protein [Thermoanaerobaculales bacterium]